MSPDATASTATSAINPSVPERAAVKPRTAASRRKLILAGLVVGAALFGAIWFLAHRGLESTDDAQVDGEVVAVPARVAGVVARVAFEENQQVKAGQLLAEIDDAPARARLAQAEANLAAATAQADAAEADATLVEANALGNRTAAVAGLQSASVGAATSSDQVHESEAQVQAAEASLAQARLDHERAERLFAEGAMPRTQKDQADTAFNLATAALQVARARLSSVTANVGQAKSHVVEAGARVSQTRNVQAVVQQARAKANAAHAQADTARAQRDLAALDLSYTKIVAPSDGEVSKKTINLGQSVAAGQTIAQLVTPKLWITANFKETQIAHMRPGQPAHVEVDAYSHTNIEGRVESLSGATGSRFTLLPPDNASGNYTKVVQRLPVRVALSSLPQGVQLRPGMSVEITVDTRH